MLDAAVIGGGPAALAAALYLARAGRTVRAFERGEIGGELSRIDNIENYPGYSGPGKDLAAKMRSQAVAAGAEVVYGECTRIERGPDQYFSLIIDGEETFKARSVLVATGSEPRKLHFPLNKPVSYCALCDGALTKGKKVAVVGGGNSALQGALYLGPIADAVTLITHSKIKADPYLDRKIRALPNITIIEDLEPTAELLNQFDYIFVFIGTKPATSWLKSLTTEEIDQQETQSSQPEAPWEYQLFDNAGYILTGDKQRSQHATVIPGLYAAGDVRAGATKQVATAVGDGVDAAIEIIDWLK